MKFLVDHQLPFRLAVHLREQRHECKHVTDLLLDEAPDAAVWRRVESEGWVLVTKDEDFIYLANLPGSTGRVVWVRLGNCRTPVLIAAFDRAMPRISIALQEGQRIIELR